MSNLILGASLIAAIVLLIGAGVAWLDLGSVHNGFTPFSKAGGVDRSLRRLLLAVALWFGVLALASWLAPHGP